MGVSSGSPPDEGFSGSPHGEIDISLLRAQLSDDDWRVRKEAALAASRSLVIPAVCDLLAEGLLQPDDVGLRNACVEAFSRVEPKGRAYVVNTLSAAMLRATPTARKFVAAALSHAGGDAIPVLLPLARDADVMTVSAALEALTAIGNDEPSLRDEISGLLIEALSRSEDVVLAAALTSLHTLGGDVPIASVRPLLERAALRSLAVLTLAQVTTSDARAHILSLLRSPETVREAALALAAQLERAEPSAADLHAEAVAAIHDLPEPARAKLVQAVGGVSVVDARRLIPLLLEGGVVEALPLLISRGLDFQGDYALWQFPAREISQQSLAARGPAILPALGLFLEGATSELAVSWALQVAVEIANDDETAATREEVAGYARGLIVRNLCVAEAWSTLDAWGLSGTRGLVKTRMLDTAPAPASMQHSRVPANIDDVHALLSSPLVEERMASLERLDLTTDEDRLELASMALADEDERVQLGALRALSRIVSQPSRQAALEHVLAMSSASSEELRVEAIASLARLWFTSEDFNAVTEWLRLVSDASPRVVIAALRAARAIEVASADRQRLLEAVFARCVRHADPEVVKEAASSAAELLVLDGSAFGRLLGHVHWSVRLRAVELASASSAPSQAVMDALRAHREFESDELVLQELGALLDAGPM
jgi:hypothetical protein